MTAVERRGEQAVDQRGVTAVERRGEQTAGGPDGPDRAEDIGAARELLRRARRVVALTGAGISTESGIPDFRGPEGVWTRDPSAERRATLRAYLDDPEVRRASWQTRLRTEARSLAPNAGHRALVDLERSGRLDLLVTQNVDGLHHLAGSDPRRVVEIHGNTREVVCLRCGDRQPVATVLERVRNGETDPSCLNDGCGGVLKTATISFGQSLVAADLERAEHAARRCDLLLAVGTSLAVYPAAGLLPLAVDAGAAAVVVNAQPTPFDHLAAVVLRGRIGAVLPRIVEGLGQVGAPGAGR